MMSEEPRPSNNNGVFPSNGNSAAEKRTPSKDTSSVDRELMPSPADPNETSSSKASGSTSGTGTSSGTTCGTASSGDTVPTSSQEAEAENSTFGDTPPTWGVMHALQSEYFYPLDLKKDRYTFGRAKQCDYNFDLPSIKRHRYHKNYSKTHFAISRTPTGDGSTMQVFIEDLGGTNGTFVNGEKIPPKQKRSIKAKDKISLSYSRNEVFLFLDNTDDNASDLPEEFTKKYIKNQFLGSGTCGQVYEVFLKGSVGRFAVKIINKARMSMSVSSYQSRNKDIMAEARILQQLQHPCIISVNDVIDSPQSLYIVLEYAGGRELFERLAKKGKLPEPIAKLYFYQMLSALTYLHDNDITHRDLKPENILLMSTEEPCLIKITDFGMSRLVDEQSLMRTLAGTPSYLAPEIMQRIHSNTSPGYTKLVDMWSLGVILYVCLVAFPPFGSGRTDTAQNIDDQILTANYNFNHSAWEQVSPLAKQLITHLLKLDFKERLNTNQAMKHPWLDDDQMKASAAKLMQPQSLSVTVNLLGERSISDVSADTRKVSTDNDEGSYGSGSKLASSSSDADKSKEKRPNVDSDSSEQVVPAKQSKVN